MDRITSLKRLAGKQRSRTVGVGRRVTGHQPIPVFGHHLDEAPTDRSDGKSGR